MAVLTIYGWTFQQWRKALEYYEQCGNEVREISDLISRAIVEPLSEAGRQILEAQAFWRCRRYDEPGEITIEVAA